MHGNAQMVGKSLATLCVARRHLWLAQSKLPDRERAALLAVPIAPGLTFGPAATRLLQVSKEDREAQMELQRLIPKPRARPKVQPSRFQPPLAVSRPQTSSSQVWRNKRPQPQYRSNTQRPNRPRETMPSGHSRPAPQQAESRP